MLIVAIVAASFAQAQTDPWGDEGEISHSARCWDILTVTAAVASVADTQDNADPWGDEGEFSPPIRYSATYSLWL